MGRSISVGMGIVAGVVTLGAVAILAFMIGRSMRGHACEQATLPAPQIRTGVGTPAYENRLQDDPHTLEAARKIRCKGIVGVTPGVVGRGPNTVEMFLTLRLRKPATRIEGRVVLGLPQSGRFFVSEPFDWRFSTPRRDSASGEARWSENWEEVKRIAESDGWPDAYLDPVVVYYTDGTVSDIRPGVWRGRASEGDY